MSKNEKKSAMEGLVIRHGSKSFKVTDGKPVPTMAKKHVKSDDPRKPAIVAALKKLTGATKITMVKQTGPSTFEGSCLKPLAHGEINTITGKARGYKDLGTFTVTLEA